MYKNKNIIALIPARGGSKGLPGKNILPMLGKPLIGWSIEAIRESKYVDKIAVSTDSQDIADVAEKFNVKVPFLRPSELATDTSPSIDAVIHAIDWYEKHGEYFDYLLLIETTSPLRSGKDIDNAIEQLVNTPGAESIVGVCKIADGHPDFLNKMKNGFLIPFQNEVTQVKRRQDLSDLYFFEGSLYLATISSIKEKKTFYHSKTLGYEVPKWKSYQIDEPSDFIIVEALMKAKLESRL